MRKSILIILVALLVTTVQTAWAFTPLTGDTWDEATKTLTVNSTPETNSYEDVDDKEKIVHLVIGSGVTTIAARAFYECTGITDVVIPATVTIIQEKAFKGCSSLTEVVLPASVKYVGVRAFYECTSLASVYIYGDHVTFLAEAFENNADGRKFYVYDMSGVGFSDDQIYRYSKSSFVEFSHSITGVKAHQNPEATNENWFTFFHPVANVEISEPKFDVEIYKATLNGTSSVTLTKMEGNKVKAGNAVLVRIVKASSTTWNPDWEVMIGIEPTTVEGDYSGNDLVGGSAVAAGCDAYTLSSNGTKMGFYLFNGTSLNANKAHLEIPHSAGARTFYSFGNDATAIESIDYGQLIMDNETDAEWYSLDGRRLSSQPAKKGMYVRDGKKFIIK